ncbi:hypothetical protein Gpo141_00014984, partial [Globisporangium polare]
AMDWAATNGHLAVVQFLHENRGEGCTTKAMDGAARSGHLNVVQFLHENRHEGCTGEAIDQAAKNKHLDVVRFLRTERQQACSLNAMVSAVERKDFEQLQILCDNRSEGTLEPALQVAVESGNLQIVKYLFQSSSEGLELSSWLKEYLVNVAATKGYMDLIQFFHEHDFFRFTPQAMHNAAVASHFEIVTFLHGSRTEGCKVDTLFECDARGDTHIVDFLCLERPMANP